MQPGLPHPDPRGNISGDKHAGLCDVWEGVDALRPAPTVAKLLCGVWRRHQHHQLYPHAGHPVHIST